jgi:Mg2+-importing ATPase
MLPTQLLMQNLLYDFSQTAIPFDDVDPEYLAKPRRWEIGSIRDFMIYIGPISSIFDYSTFALMWFLYGVGTHPHDASAQSLFQSGWFVEGLLTQTFIVHMIRTSKIPFIQSRASWSLIASTAVIMAVGIAIPYTALGHQIGMTPLPMSYYPWLVGTLLTYAVLTQVVKSWFLRKYAFD